MMFLGRLTVESVFVMYGCIKHTYIFMDMYYLHQFSYSKHEHLKSVVHTYFTETQHNLFRDSYLSF